MRNCIVIYEPRGDWADQRDDSWIGDALGDLTSMAAHLAQHAWLVRTEYTVGALAERLERSTDHADMLAVFELTDGYAGHWGGSRHAKLHYDFRLTFEPSDSPSR